MAVWLVGNMTFLLLCAGNEQAIRSPFKLWEKQGMFKFCKMSCLSPARGHALPCLSRRLTCLPCESLAGIQPSSCNFRSLLVLSCRVFTKSVTSCSGNDLAGRKLLQSANPVQTTAGDVQTLEDEANADIADTAVDDAFGRPSPASFDPVMHC